MAKYRKKPVVVEAIRWNVPDENGKVLLAQECKDHPAVRLTSYLEVSEMLGTVGCSKELPYWDWSVMGVIDTLEGKHIVSPGDYIIKGIKGEFYPCKPDIFEATYEKVNDENPETMTKETSLNVIVESLIEGAKSFLMKCPSCGKRTISSQQAYIHDNIKREWYCRDCGQRLNNYNLLKEV